MRIDPTKIELPDLYHWMISTITPRPIAWVSTVSASGLTNLAPFSFFQGVTANPPTLLFSVANNRHGEKKDTVRNIEEVPEFVVNVVSYDLREPMNRSSASLPYGVNEFEVAKVRPIPSEKIRPPRVAESAVSFECRLQQIVRVGEGPLAGNVIFGTILLLHVQERVLDSSGQVDPGKLDTIGRMGASWYARTTDRFVLERPGS
ncbi:MAG TPA: flavin reductase family protein [Chthoniobacterales bacterium]|nr:flavin reductase family protein [Chthoniobacterales bacterium]